MSSAQPWSRPKRESSSVKKPQQQKPFSKGRYHGMNKLSDYIILEQLGQGTFGIVSKARQRSSNKLVALKKLIIHDKKDGFPITAFREITIMKKFKNINVLQLLDMIHERSDESTKDLTGFFYTVTPYISSDLNGLLNNPRIKLTVPQIKCIMKQILSGMNYIHNENYLHRDIKTANILLDYFGVVKIADFGLSRVYFGAPPEKPEDGPGGGKLEYTGLVVTRWYRPPELLLGEKKYTTAVDMWGIGCVLGEMYKKRPILEGNSDLDQADIIFKLLGAPNESNFPNYTSINRNGVMLNVNYERTLEREYKALMSPPGVELLSKLLTLDPKKRANAAKALQSDYFTTLPLPCKPQELPKFEESHESDIKRYKEEVKRAATVASAAYKPNTAMEYTKYDDHSKYGGTYFGPDESFNDQYSNGNGLRLERSRSNYSRFLPNEQELDQGGDAYYDDYYQGGYQGGYPPQGYMPQGPSGGYQGGSGYDLYQGNYPPEEYYPEAQHKVRSSWTQQHRKKSRTNLTSSYRPESYRSSSSNDVYRLRGPLPTAPRERPSSKANGNDLYGDEQSSSLSAIKKLLHGNKKRKDDGNGGNGNGNENDGHSEKKQKKP